MKRKRPEKYFWASWLFATVLSGMVLGFYVSHSIVLGPFFSWFIESGKYQLLNETYATFRHQHPTNLYYILLGIQGLASFIFMISTWINGHNLIAGIIVGVCAPLAGVIHSISGFGILEINILSGRTVGQMELTNFTRWNVPIHLLYALIMLVGVVTLLLIPLKIIWREET